MSQNPAVKSFVSSVQSRLFLHLFWNTLIWTLLTASTITVIIGVGYVIQGYAVPRMAYVAVAISAAISAGILLLSKKPTTERAARYADDHFDLKDSVTSFTHFELDGLKDGFYALQSRQTVKATENLAIQSIRYQIPKLTTFVAVGVTLFSAVLFFKGPSEFVIEREKQTQQNLELTASANSELDQLVKELEESIDDPEERKLLDPDQLRKWVNELKTTGDKKEAMRQYAKLERKLRQANNALMQRREEQLLDRSADELNKTDELKALAKKLKQKKYDKAASDLENLKPTPLKPEDLKKLSEKKKQLAKLKAAAQRMALVARTTGSKKSDANQSSSKNQSKNAKVSQSDSSPNASQMDLADQDAEERDQQNELAQLMEELEESVEEFDESLEKLELSDIDESDFEDSEECQNCQASESDLDEKLDRLTKKIKRMAKQRKARSKLDKLASQCAECQSALATAQLRKPGGKKPGGVAGEKQRDTEDELVDNGQTTAIKGIKGRGPALTTVESASDGDGVSGKRSKDANRDYQKQFESFINREDVPENLKAGVKNYFNNIHQSQEQEK